MFFKHKGRIVLSAFLCSTSKKSESGTMTGLDFPILRNIYYSWFCRVVVLGKCYTTTFYDIITKYNLVFSRFAPKMNVFVAWPLCLYMCPYFV